MSTIVERYDRDAEDYERYWAPVLDACARRLLDRVEPLVDAARRNGHEPGMTARRLGRLRGAGVGHVAQPFDPGDIADPGVRDVRILDIGTGSGVLALEAYRRWPDAIVFGVDPSAGMLGMARRRATSEGLAGDESRLRWLRAPADALDVAAASVDVAVSSFVFQLVPDRAAALGEALRVLRPGGWLALVTWLDRGPEFAPAIEFDEAVYDLDIAEPEDEEEARAGDFRSPRGAAGELRSAGFRRVSARAETLEYRWTRQSYLDFKLRYDEQALFSWLDRETAEELLARVQERFAALPDDAFTWQADVVSVVGQRPPGAAGS